MKLVQACLSAGKLRCNRFNHCGCPVKAVRGGFNPSKNGETSCNHLAAPVKFGQDCLIFGRVHYNEFNHCGGPVKAVKGVFNLRKD